jgi:hypothetical protein
MYTNMILLLEIINSFNMFNFDLSHAIERYLINNRESREFDIIRHLQSINLLPNDALREPLSMFRCHFMIFNALYRLQLNTHIHQRYGLTISSLKISLSEYSLDNKGDSALNGSEHSEKSDLQSHDPLSLFYLDYGQVMQTTEQDVNKLLDQFWKGFLNDDQKQNALNILGLSDPVDFNQIKKQYRRLAMKHHPDRGGDADQLIAVHQAMQCLEMYY